MGPHSVYAQGWTDSVGGRLWE